MGLFADAVRVFRQQGDHAGIATCGTRVGGNRYQVTYRGQTYILPLTLVEQLRDGQRVVVLVRRGVPISILGSLGAGSGGV